MSVNIAQRSLQGTGEVKCISYGAVEWPRLAPVWSMLAESSPYSSFFLGTDWTASWLAVFGERLRAELLLFSKENAPVGICLAVPSVEAKGPFKIRRIHLHTGGEGELHESIVEHNNLLCLPGCEEGVANALAAWARSREWDEVVAGGFCPGPPLDAFRRSFAWTRQSAESRPSYYAALDNLTAEGKTFEQTLSRRRRQKLRHYRNLIGEQLGPLRVEGARDLAEALSMFDEMIALHQASWNKRGRPGAFASPEKVRFHRRLISSAFPAGIIQLLRIVGGQTTIGVLYNFVQNGKVYHYQQGVLLSDDPRMHAGDVANSMAIDYCLEHGLKEFDHLAGTQFYKQWLSTDSRQLCWLVFRRPSARMALIELLRSIKRRLRAFAAQTGAPSEDDEPECPKR